MSSSSDRGHDVIVRGPRTENSGNPGSFHLGHVHFGNDASDDDRCIESCVTERVHDRGSQGQVRAIVHRHTDDVYVLLGDGSRDHLGGLAEPGEDHLESGIAQDARDHSEPTIVAVQPDLSQEDADRSVRIHYTNERSNQVPKTVSSAPIDSPTVT